MAANAVNYDVVPMPQNIVEQQGEPFVLNNDVKVLAADGLRQEAEFLQAYVNELTGLSLQTLDKYSNLGFGQHTREIICHGIAPAEE